MDDIVTTYASGKAALHVVVVLGIGNGLYRNGKRLVIYVPLES